jgi:hypothetical protein
LCELLVEQPDRLGIWNLVTKIQPQKPHE